MSGRNTSITITLRAEEVAALEKIAKEYGVSVSRVAGKFIASRLIKEGKLEFEEGIEGFYKYKDIQ